MTPEEKAREILRLARQNVGHEGSKRMVEIIAQALRDEYRAGVEAAAKVCEALPYTLVSPLEAADRIRALLDQKQQDGEGREASEEGPLMSHPARRPVSTTNEFADALYEVYALVCPGWATDGRPEQIVSAVKRKLTEPPKRERKPSEPASPPERGAQEPAKGNCADTGNGLGGSTTDRCPTCNSPFPDCNWFVPSAWTTEKGAELREHEPTWFNCTDPYHDSEEDAS